MDVATILKLKGKTVVTTTADKSLLDVAKLLTLHGIGCIVIVSSTNDVTGIVSERDLVRAIGQCGAKVLEEPVSVHMTKSVVSAREADTIDRLMSEMTVNRFRHMPVVEQGQLIGLVSIGDVVKMHVTDIECEVAVMRRYITTGGAEPIVPVKTSSAPWHFPHDNGQTDCDRCCGGSPCCDRCDRVTGDSVFPESLAERDGRVSRVPLEELT
jgi:CBS domain-containing protein